MIYTRVGSFCLLPFDKFKIHTKQNILNTREAIVKETRLATLSELRQRERVQEETFYGEIGETHFTIKRSISYKNSFIPIIKGTLKNSEFSIQGTQIEIKLRMSIFVMMFGLVWFGVMIFMLLSIIIHLVSDKNSNSETVIPIAMMLFGYFLFTGSFSYEAAKARKLLLVIFEGKEV